MGVTTVERVRPTMPTVVLALVAVGLAIAAQGFVGGRTHVYDGLVLYVVAALIARRVLVLPTESTEPPADSAKSSGTQLVAPPNRRVEIGLFVVTANLLALLLFAAGSSPNLAWISYVASAVAAPVGVWLLSGRPPIRPFAGWRRADLWALAAILAIGLIVRTYRLEDQPWGLWFDEATNGLEALHVMRDPSYRPVYVPGVVQVPALITYTTIPWIVLIGPTSAALRATAVVAGTIGIVAIFLLGRELFDRRVGIVAGAIAATMTWHVNFSRFSHTAIWSAALNALTAYFLVQALRTRRLLSFALAGTTLGLALNMYYTSRIFPLVIAAFLLHRLIAGRLLFLRQNALGLLVFAAVTAITVSPLAEYAILHPREFNNRTQQVTVLNEVNEQQSFQPILENVRKHLLMFHYRGDGNGRHNLPGAPMLDQVLGALFLLGLVIAVPKVRRAECFLPVAWIPIMLIGGVLTLSFEAPQSIRTIDETTAVALLSALPLVALWKRLEVVVPDELQMPRWLTGADPVRISAAGVAIAALLVWIGALNVQRYFGRQATDFAVWNAFSTPETVVGREAARLGDDYQVYFGETFLGHPAIRFLTGDHTRFNRFEAAGTLPLRDQKNVAILLEAEHEATFDLLRRLYPDAEFRAYRPPFDGPAVALGAFISADQIAAVQGVQGAYYDDGAWTGEPVYQAPAPAIDFDWTNRLAPRMPFSAEFRATLVAPEYGSYVFRLEAPTGSEVLLDEVPLVHAGEAKAVVLAEGTHALRVRVAVPEPARVQLLWQPPGSDRLEVVPTEALFLPPVRNNGLLGSYYQNADWRGQPALERIDPVLGMRFHLTPLPRPYSVEWRGKIDVPYDGIYSFAVESADASWLYVDEQLVATNEDAPRQLREGAVQLTGGLHDIRIRYRDATGHSFARVFWTPPGGEREIVPSERLFPPQGAYLERAPALPAPAAQVPGDGPRVVPSTPLPPAPYVPTTSFGEPGEGTGQLLSPRGAAIDAQGNVYVVDGGSARVQKFDSDGRLLTTWGGKGTGPAEFGEPVAVVVDPAGLVAVLDAEEHWIRRFTPDGEPVDQIAGPSAGFYFPRGLAVDAAGNYYVADTGRSRVVQIGPTGEVLGSFGVKGSALAQIIEPTDVAIAADGTFYVVDSANNKVVQFDAGWQPVAEWPVPRSTSVLGPHLVATDFGIFVTDPEGRRVIRYDEQGRPLDQIGTGDELQRPVGISRDPAGRLYVVDERGGRVVQFAPEGEAAPPRGS